MRDKTIHRAVGHCITIFEKADPNWLRRIDRRILDVRDKKGNPIVQVFGNILDGIATLGIQEDPLALDALFPKGDRRAREINRTWQHAISVREMADVA